LQVVPSQQPAQDVASQLQRPPTHLWPAEHTAPPPQPHCPAAEQPSLTVVSHATHAPPAAPHVAGDGALHVAPVQQPSGHSQLLHLPAVQASPGGHAEHA